MGLGSLIVGVVIGAGALIIVQKAQADEGLDIPDLPIFDPPPQLIDVISIVVDPLRIDPDTWQFEASYFNRFVESLRTEVFFKINDSQGRNVVSEKKTITIEPGASVKIFWDSGDLATASPLTGDFTAIFTAEERGSFDQLAVPVTIIFPVGVP